MISNFQSRLCFLIFAGLALNAVPSIGCTKEGTAPPLNFDIQLIHILETTAAHRRETSPASPLSAQQENALERILSKLRHHRMMLKNAVYRTDMGVIRLTWADDENEDVVKVAYKTAKDPVLGNSVYADKRQVIDVKIMYRSEAKVYEYLRFSNRDNTNSANMDMPTPVPATPQFNFSVQSRLTNEQCGFCHVLAQNDGSPKGVFFPRYQESYGHPSASIKLPWRMENFAMMHPQDTEKLGLPGMAEDFLYQKVVVGIESPAPESVQFARTLIEAPQLVEVWARDNNQSTCIAVDFGQSGAAFGMGRNDYVCADNREKRLYVRLTNNALTINHGPKDYSEPYFVKP